MACGGSRRPRVGLVRVGLVGDWWGRERGSEAACTPPASAPAVEKIWVNLYNFANKTIHALTLTMNTMSTKVASVCMKNEK